MIKIDKDIKVWITSDTHYNHSNICLATTKWRNLDGSIPYKQVRDFSSLDKMNSVIVDNINDVVNQDDVLIHLGDWSFGGFEMIEEFHNRLICKNIHLVLGNHDHHIDRNRNDVQKLFSSVNWFTQLEYMGETLELMHYPISSWNGLRKGRIHIHGHCHLPNHLKINNGRRIDCGMDGHPEFRPYDLLKEIINPMRKVEIGSELGGIDHHTNEVIIIG